MNQRPDSKRGLQGSLVAGHSARTGCPDVHGLGTQAAGDRFRACSRSRLCVSAVLSDRPERR